MTTRTLIFRSLRHHARSHLGTLLGAAVGSGILAGALLVGDSVRGTLREMALRRLGSTTAAVASGDRLFRTALAQDLGTALGTNALAVPVLEMDGVAGTAGGEARANNIKVLGVDERFWRLATASPQLPSPGADEVLLNERLARQLGAELGQTVILRVAKPSALSREAPLTPQEDASVALRLAVAGVVPDDVMGAYSLQPGQIPPFNAFLHLPALQDKLGLAGKANRLLVAGATTADAEQALAAKWTLADAELELRALPGGNELELRTSRVFLDPEVGQSARSLHPSARPIVTYFVNELRAGERATPYSMVTAAAGPWLPPGAGTNAIALNQWLADDLQARVGDEVQLGFFAVGTARRLEERTARFQVAGVVPLAGAAADPTLMPEFPGIEKADSTRDWDSSLPIEMSRIRDQDEKYWHEHRGTPKAFITLEAGEALWTNRFGVLTAVRYPTGPDAEAGRVDLARELRARLQPALFGLRFEPVREQAMAAVAQSQDFGGLFIGFSLFLIVAALLLMGLLFRFGLEQRVTETGTLLALGFRPRQVRRLLLLEGGLLALLGGIAGTAAGVVYARWMIHGLSTAWVDAVGTTSLQFHAAPVTLLAGAIAGTIVGCATMWLVLRRQAAQPARVLLAGGGDEPPAAARGPARRPALVAAAAAILALALAGQAVVRGDTASAGSFFGAGALLLLAGLAACSAWLRGLDRPGHDPVPSLPSLALRGAVRRRGRSLTTIGLLASGIFLIVAISAFQLDAVRDADRRASGTGGFAFFGSSTFPVVQDLDTEAGRAFYALDGSELNGVRVVGMRVRDGDEASCLNLNRAQQPRLVGVNPDALASRGAFTFAKALNGVDAGPPWLSLKRWEDSASGPAVVPAIGDLNSILWAMGRKVGDELLYRDERGREFRVRLVGAVANSILQGNLLIDEAAFVKLFPSEPGYRMFLVDAPVPGRESVASVLSRGLRDAGLELVPTAARLAAFNAVQNTYLGTFQLLGGLGLVLGSAGLGIVVLRNVLERRGELALMRAVGFGPGALRRLVLAEHAALMLAGLAVGVVAAAVAVLPALLSPGTILPWRTLVPLVAGAGTVGLGCAWIATRLALRGDLLRALRSE